MAVLVPDKTAPVAARTRAWLDANAHRFDLSVQFLGDEPNARGKSWADAELRWCLVAAWPYEAAAGNSSIPAVYAAINDSGAGNYLCDRFYLPNTPRDLKLLEKAGIGAFGIETSRPLTAFDVVGSSISYPVLSMSYVKQLTMSGVPARRAEREQHPEKWPMIIAGGLSYGCPEMLAEVVDCWWLGEIEDEPGNPGISDVCHRIAGLKTTGRWHRDRAGCYAALAQEFGFLYFPRFVDTHYGYEDRGLDQPSKQVIGYTSNLPGMRLPLRRRIVKNLDNAAPLTAPPLLYADPAMGAGDLEVARGCPAWCSFCSLSYHQKPYRQRTVDNVLDFAGEFARNMGSVRLAPFSPDFPMYTEKKILIRRLLEEVCDEVDAATMRVDDFIADNQFMLLQVNGGMDAVTLGVEGNSQRMRDLVGKGVADADIRQAVTQGIRAGIRRFKLYMISNLPGEDEGDVFRVLSLAKDLADIRDSMNQPTVKIQFSWTPLMIEAGTPFQWFAPTLTNRLLADVFEQFRDLKIEFKVGAKAEPNKLAFFQLCQRASRHVGAALLDAMLAADQACWGGVPRTFAATLQDALRAHGFHNGFADCFDERGRTDMFGWEHIDAGINRRLLWATYTQMRDFAIHTDSHSYDQQYDDTYHGAEWIARCDERCQGKRCGACDHTDLKIRQRYLQTRDTDTDLTLLKPVDQSSQVQRLRIRLNTAERYRHVQTPHWRFAIRRAGLRAIHRLGWDLAIAKRSIRFASDEVKGADHAAGLDYLEFALTRRLDTERINQLLAEMNIDLHPWLTLGDWRQHPVTAPSFRADAAMMLYEIDTDLAPHTIAARLTRWHAGEPLPVRLPVVGGYFAAGHDTVDARTLIHDVWPIRRGNTPALALLTTARPPIHHLYAGLVGERSHHAVAHLSAQRVEVFTRTDLYQQDNTRPACQSCVRTIPVALDGTPYTYRWCPRCAYTADGLLLTEAQPV